MVRTFVAGSLVALAATLATPAMADPPHEAFVTRLNGFNEVGLLNNEEGAIFTGGSGTLQVVVNHDAQTIDYKLTFSNLSSNVTQSHIHFGKVHMAGGVMVFLCTNLGNAPAGTPACPASGTVTGTITVASLLPIAGQGVPAGSFQAIEEALETRTAYVNVHTANFPTGEIRGELSPAFF